MSRNRAKPVAPKPPKEYGEVLADFRRALGFHSLKDFAKKVGVDYNTLLRNENGSDLRSVKGSTTYRDELVKVAREQGRDAIIPPVPVGDEAAIARPVPTLPKLDPADEVVRRNLIRFREAIGLDQFDAAFVTKVPYEELRAYELGESTPITPVLARIASAYGCKTGAFFDESDTLPNFEERQVTFHYGGPGTRHLTDAQRQQLADIAASVTAADRAEKLAGKTPKKRR